MHSRLLLTRVRMKAWISAAVVPARPGPIPVWNTFVRIPAALRAAANVLAAVSVEGLVMTTICSPQRRMISRRSILRSSLTFINEWVRRRWNSSQGSPSSSVKVCGPPTKPTVTSTDFRSTSFFESALYCAVGICSAPMLRSRIVPSESASAGFAGTTLSFA